MNGAGSPGQQCWIGRRSRSTASPSSTTSWWAARRTVFGRESAIDFSVFRPRTFSASPCGGCISSTEPSLAAASSRLSTPSARHMRRSVPNWLMRSGCCEPFGFSKRSAGPPERTVRSTISVTSRYGSTSAADANELALALEESNPLAQVGGRAHRSQSRALVLLQRPVRSRANGLPRAEHRVCPGRDGNEAHARRVPAPFPRRSRRSAECLPRFGRPARESARPARACPLAKSTELKPTRQYATFSLQPIRRAASSPAAKCARAWSNRPSPSSAKPRSHKRVGNQRVPLVLLRDRQRLFERRSSVPVLSLVQRQQAEVVRRALRAGLIANAFAHRLRLLEQITRLSIAAVAHRDHAEQVEGVRRAPLVVRFRMKATELLGYVASRCVIALLVRDEPRAASKRGRGSWPAPQDHGRAPPGCDATPPPDGHGAPRTSR